MKKIKDYAVALTTLEPLRIGGVEDPVSGIDNPVTMVGNRLVVPGPSLKGALRNEVERHLIYLHWKDPHSFDNKQAFQPCIPTTRLSSHEQKLLEQAKYRKVSCHYPCDKRPCSRENQQHSICPVCYLFGAMGLPGFVRVPFLFSDVSSNELYSSRIDRSTGTVVEGTNRPYQLVPDGAQFKGVLQILIEDPLLGWQLGKPRPFPAGKTKGDEWLIGAEKNPDELIKEFIIERLQGITMIGGYKSKGFGRVKIEVKPL